MGSLFQLFTIHILNTSWRMIIPIQEIVEVQEEAKEVKALKILHSILKMEAP